MEAESVRGRRHIAIDDFFLGVKRNALAPDELIRAVRVPVARRAAAVRQGRHPQRHGDRGLHGGGRAGPGAAHGRHRHRLGGTDAAAGPRGRGFAAEPCPGRAASRSTTTWCREFGARVAAAAAPIDDVRGTAAYRRHALAVLARRALRWAWAELTGGAR